MYQTGKITRTFYKYYNTDIEKIQWLTITPSENVSGLIYMDEFSSTEEDFKPEWEYSSFIRELLNTSTY